MIHGGINETGYIGIPREWKRKWKPLSGSRVKSLGNIANEVESNEKEAGK